MPKGEDGFTLIELIVVMVIIGILAVAVIPRFVDNQAFPPKLHQEFEFLFEGQGTILLGIFLNCSYPFFILSLGNGIDSNLYKSGIEF